MNKRLELALKYVNSGYKVYPLVKDTKIPIKNTHGYKSSTNDIERVKRLWANHDYNIGLDLTSKNILCVDIDLNHSNGANGWDNYIKACKEFSLTPMSSDTYVERTPNGGLHWFLSYPTGTSSKNLQSIFFETSGIDVVTTGLPIYPSSIDGKQYKPIDVYTLQDVKPAPQWILDLFGNSTSYKQSTPRRTNWTGTLLNDLDAGTDQGNRNAYLTSLCGRLFATGAKSKVIYDLLEFANEHLSPPLPVNEVNTIYHSILKREVVDK